MTDRTKKFLSVSRAVEAHFLVEVDAYDQASGTTKKIRAIHRSRAKQISSEWYFDILHHRTGISPITSNVAPQGGIGFQSNVSVHMSAPAELDRYSYIGQSLIIYLHTPYTGDLSQVFLGTVQSTQSRSRGIVLRAANNTRDASLDIPSQRLTFGAFPNAPLSGIGLPVPVVFGDMDVPPTLPSTAYLAPAVCIDALELKFMPTVYPSSNYGALYVWDVGLNAFVPIPHTQDGRIAQASRAATVEVGADLSPSPNVTVSSLASNLPFGRPGNPNNPNNAVARQDIVATEGVHVERAQITATFLSADDIAAGSGLRQLHCSVFVWIKTRAFLLGSPGMQWFRDGRFRGFGANVEDTLTLYIDQEVGSALSSGDAFIYWYFYRATGVTPPSGTVNISMSAACDLVYQNPILDARAIPNTYQAITGYIDRQENYKDGGPVRAEGEKLTSPIDVVIALLRDDEVGAGAKSQNVITHNVAAIRDRLGTARIDGQIGTSRVQSFSEWQNLLRSFGISLQVSGGEYRILDDEASPSAILTDHNIIDISTEQSPISEIYTEYVLDYHYSHATGQYAKRLVADPHHIGVADGRTTGNTVILFGGGISGILSGHRVHIEGAGISETRDVARVDGNTVHVDGNSLPDVNPVRVWVGPYFDYQCHLSTEKYGHQRPKIIQMDLVADDATARQILSREIAYNTPTKYRIRLRCPIGAARIQQGDRICIDHRDLPVPIQASEVARYPSGLPYAQTDITTGLTPPPTETSGILFARQRSATEALRVGAGRGRGLIETLRQNWPSGTKVYHQSHISRVTRREINPRQDIVTLHTETLEIL